MQTKKKILFVITKGNWGGAQKYVYELAHRLPTESYEVYVAHGVGDILPQKLKAVEIPSIYLPSLGRDISIVKDIISFFDLIKLFRKEKPYIVHLNSSKIGGIGALAARIARIPKIVFTVHGFAFNEERPWIQKAIISFLSWITTILCTDVVCISQIEYAQASQWPGISSKLHLIYNGIPTPDFLSTDDARRMLLDILQIPESIMSGKKIVGTIGELTQNKGHIYALTAIKEIPDCIYIIIGEGEEHTALQEFIAQHNLKNKIFLTGFIKDASTLLKAFSFFLLPSLKEGMPYVLLEAGLAQVPVITTPVGGIKEIITNREEGFFIMPQSSESIYTTLSEIIAYTNNLNHISTQLKNKVEKSFSVDNMVQLTTTMYELVV
ncbi:MAG: glycosyltransferase [Nitrosopumilus sp.]|nr:glycosyltransferase [Nitrosopumilus sp.]